MNAALAQYAIGVAVIATGGAYAALIAVLTVRTYRAKAIAALRNGK